MKIIYSKFPILFASLLVFVFSFSNKVLAGGCTLTGTQTVTMSATTCDITCPATITFRDPGGAFAYSTDLDIVQTFTNLSGNPIQISFASFNTEEFNDLLYVYDGNSIVDPQVAGSPFSGLTIPSSIISSGGSLTFQFTSDPSSNRPGFEATITCVPACSGTPLAGTAVAFPSTVCVGGFTDISVTGVAVALGLTYQWQSSSDNATWVDDVGETSETYFASPVANTYYRRVTTCSGNSANSMSVLVPVGAPANDDCSGAIALNVNPTLSCGSYTSSTVNCASASPPGKDCGVAANPDDDVWFKFVATSTEHRISLLNIVGSVDNMFFSVYSGTCGALVLHSCNDPNVGNFASLTIGLTYYVRVYTKTAAPGQNTAFNICVTSPPIPQCANYSFPLNGMTGSCSTTSYLAWNAPLVGAPTGYKLFFGTNFPPTNIINGTNVGNVLAHTQATAASTVYYWKIIPLNGTGDAIGCSVQSFTTGAACVTNNMDNTPLTTCSGLFYDSGGLGANYGNNENFTKTICSDGGVGSSLVVNFHQFITYDFNDNLSIYDGNSDAAPLIGNFSSTNRVGVITATGTCLTFVFTSNAATATAGWRALIGCYIPSPLIACIVVPPPGNDLCEDAIDLGTLTSPAVCPSGAGAIQNFVIGNCNATAEIPYRSLLACLPAGDMAAPAADVWYKFTATGTKLDINLSGNITTPNIGLWQGKCGSLTGRFCAVGSSGSLSVTFEPLVAGQEYYLQISGGNVADKGNAYLKLKNSLDCTECLKSSELTLIPPPPANGNYGPNQPVEFCYTVTNWDPPTTSWIHGVNPSFGNGWDVASLVPLGTVPICDSSGEWLWLNSCTGDFSGNTYGPGWYYDGDDFDGNPGNNFGDFCSWPLNKEFCWRINTKTTANCTSGEDLSMIINVLGDSESGSWFTPACATDASPVFKAVSDCTLPAVPLDVKVINLSAENKGNTNSITWEFSIQKRIKSYVLQKSQDGYIYKETATFFATSKENEVTRASFLDKNIFRLNYYRIKIIYSNGSIDYSQIVSVNAKEQNFAVNFYPNPATNELFVDFYSSIKHNGYFDITDITGKIVEKIKMEINEGNNSLSINVLSLQAGMYFAKYNTEYSNVLFYGKFIKQ